jgi:phosphoribosylformylglycinamidine synthase
VTLVESHRADLALFGEGPSRIVVTVETERASAFEALMAEWSLPWCWIGQTGGTRMVVEMGGRPLVSADLNRLQTAWRMGFERHVG